MNILGLGNRIHLKWPAQFKQLLKFQQKKLEMEFGQRAKSSSNRVGRSEIEEALMLTGDLNVAVVPWKTQYRIAGRINFYLK